MSEELPLHAKLFQQICDDFKVFRDVGSASHFRALVLVPNSASGQLLLMDWKNAAARLSKPFRIHREATAISFKGLNLEIVTASRPEHILGLEISKAYLCDDPHLWDLQKREGLIEATRCREFSYPPRKYLNTKEVVEHFKEHQPEIARF